ncbi:MAG: hypothetical protein CMQ12_09100 [Gammaproteobacteria bacterium]|nr:hypothetical protein [Gammaproteobacteria bacterium]
MPSNTIKILAAVSLLALVALTVMPKVVGVGIEDTTVTNLVDLIPLQARDQVTITSNRFDSGWFSSSAVIDVDYSPFGTILGALPIAVQIILDIQHGPILFTPNGLGFGLAYVRIIPKLRDGELESALSQLPFDLPGVDIGLLAGFDQSLRVRLEVAPINYSDSQGHLFFDGLSGSFVSHGDNSAEFSLSMGKLEAEENGSTIGFTMSGLELTSSTSQLNHLLAPSSATLTIPRIAGGTPHPFTVDGISAESRLQTSTAGAAQTDISQRLEIASIDSEFPLNSISWTSEINGIQNHLFQRYYGLLAGLQTQISVPASPATASIQMNQLSQEPMLVLARNRLVFNNRIAASAYDGNHSIDLSIDWNGLPELDNITRLNLNTAIDALTVKLDVSLDLAAIMRSPAAEMVDPYVQQQYIRLDHGRILLNGSVEDGELVLNGELIPLDQLF